MTGNRADLQNINLPDHPELFREMASQCVVDDGRLLQVARVLARAGNCGEGLVDIFRDSLDQFLALYYSPGEAKLSLDLIDREAPAVFAAVRKSLAKLVSFGKEIPQDGAETYIPIPSWDRQTINVPASRILTNRRIALLWHLTGIQPELDKNGGI